MEFKVVYTIVLEFISSRLMDALPWENRTFGTLRWWVPLLWQEKVYCIRGVPHSKWLSTDYLRA